MEQIDFLLGRRTIGHATHVRNSNAHINKKKLTFDFRARTNYFAGILRNPQATLIKKPKSAYGGELRKKRTGRGARPLSTRQTMHLVLRSSRARGEKSFLRLRSRARIQQIINKFAAKYAVEIIDFANVGNHLHLHIKLAKRFTYAPFIRAVTGAIALFVGERGTGKFWDLRPFTRVVESLRGFLNLQDYVQINQYETLGFARDIARDLAKAPV